MLAILVIFALLASASSFLSPRPSSLRPSPAPLPASKSLSTPLSPPDLPTVLSLPACLLFFSAPWCGPCRLTVPAVDAVQPLLPCFEVNVDEAEEIVDKFGVEEIPTVLVLRGGRERGRVVGTCTEAVLRREIGRVLEGKG
ncbi:hypothetical protein TeGR_g14183 [Tetraparma gracilis]|uniref:Thioredoxin domain-containing protein n=1 Tax=Tetraparma gracilis TaxID=2962635 RepID=A0ABQ6MF19_9STRA|nr:hypothetical protein TeGR_g14183 [Tetraparma gracilis]